MYKIKKNTNNFILALPHYLTSLYLDATDNDLSFMFYVSLYMYLYIPNHLHTSMKATHSRWATPLEVCFISPLVKFPGFLSLL